jgi:hypothetical protein
VKKKNRVFEELNIIITPFDIQQQQQQQQIFKKSHPSFKSWYLQITAASG